MVNYDILKILSERRDALKFDYEQKCDSLKNMTDAQLYGTMYPTNAITSLVGMQETRTRIDELNTVITIIENMGDQI